ncbi:NAD(P)-dependent dehydrogenase, short-chain alcohol dehydrogenase family [Devosia sp. YR412]|uniref:SDR family NAD(P)-dependent oxidoreductase n=1 Tax=Devosia sp. YR412 TaxID=1881030 RepID=UPI0008CAB3FF|nr:SDR family oxidoreductase [Devosia sp. YR412]SEQ06423.1 NAD(P)-dependent dehydrogenase, short-chain alcohol dehydrogenase family [Devosia sp. YR412]
MDLNLRDKVAVITGGTVGIGLAIAEGLAAEGANLVLVGRNKERTDDEVARVADRFGVIAMGISADVATAEGCDAVIKGATKGFGGVDILINNAGTGSNETIAEADDAKWQYYWELHVMAAVRLARGLVPSMKKRGGGVVLHNASICAVQPLWYEPIYNTTKAALMMFSKTLANEVVGDNIRVNTVNPGLVLTPDWIKTAKQIAGEAGWQAHLQGVADEAGGMKRFATPEELANFFVFMCSDKASYSTGSTYFVDGGWLKTV